MGAGAISYFEKNNVDFDAVNKVDEIIANAIDGDEINTSFKWAEKIAQEIEKLEGVELKAAIYVLSLRVSTEIVKKYIRGE